MSAQARKVSRTIEVDVTVDTNIYAASDALHTGAILLTGAVQGHNHSGTIQSVVVIDQAKQSAALACLFFTDNPSGSTITANAALDISDAELDDYFIGSVPIAAADYEAFSDNSAATVRNAGLHFRTDEPNDRNIYMVVMSKGTPTYAASTDVRVKVTIEQD